MQTITASKKSQQGKNLSQYAGQWLAFVDNKIVAQGNSLKDLTQKIDKKGLRKKASVFLVPRKDEGPYVLLFL